jgi:hypothetical protein
MVGIDGVDTDADIDRLEACVVPAQKGIRVQFSLEDHGQIIANARRGVEKFRQTFFADSLRRRRDLLAEVAAGRLDEQHLPKDMLMLLLAAGHGTEQQVMRICISAIGGGIGNPIAVICHAMDEADRWTGHDLPALLRIGDDIWARLVNETIRLHRTGAPYLLRHVSEEARLEASGLELAGGTEVAMDMRRVNRDPQVFGPDAESFNPLRATTVPRVKPYALGFGTGPHVCIAKRMMVNDNDTENPRTLGLVLRTLIRNGVRPDPTSAPVRDTHGNDRYSIFPVMVTQLGQPNGAGPALVGCPWPGPVAGHREVGDQS